MSRILVVEDDDKIRANLIYLLRQIGHEPHALASGEDAFATLVGDGAGPQPDLLLLDVRLPGLSGVELVRSLNKAGRLPLTIMISGEASITEAVEALQLGVRDFIEKPFGRERLVTAIDNALEHARLTRELADLRDRVGEDGILGESAAMDEVRDLIAKAAATEARVLVLGESGTGKELVADALHQGSRRREQPFVKINCASIPAQLVESELFGHARGAFTDARESRAGLFEEADGGTLFLDEIGDMPPELQSRLLRVLEDGRVRRLGDGRERSVDVRVIAATNRDLESSIEGGSFRRDLFYRLCNLPIELPPLRERRGDIRPLFEHFVERFRRRHRTGQRRIDDDVFPLLERHTWPGNVRELKALAERLVIFAGDPITAARLPPPIGGGSTESLAGFLQLPTGQPPLTLRELRIRVEREYVEAVLERTAWNVSEAARVLGIARTYLHQKLADLGLERPGTESEAKTEPEAGVDRVASLE